MAYSQYTPEVNPKLEESKILLHAFISEFLGVSFLSYQSTFGTKDYDLLTFRCPDGLGAGSTLAVPATVLLEPQEVAREIVAKKILSCRQSFTRGAH